MKNIFYPKLIESMKGYTKQKLLNDIIAGIIVAIIALPLSIALALASGVKPEQGLYTAIVAGFVIALLGGSRVQISGPTAAFATIVAGIVATKGLEGLAVATVTAGAILILMGILRLGKLIKFIPHTITVGFTGGIALTLLIGQVKDFAGLTFTHSPIETLEKLIEVIKTIGTINWQAILIGAVSLAILIIWPKIKYINKIPPSLIAVIISAGLVALLNMKVNTIGSLYTVSSALPKFNLPNFNLFVEMLPNAFTIAALAAIESLLSCVVSDGMIKDKHNSNTELIAQGAGNICSALFGGIPATGAIARTAANVKNGGQSPISGIIHAIVLLLILVVLMPYAALIPMPAIAAILFIVAYNMSEWREFVHIIKTSHFTDILVLVTTCVLTVVFDLVVAIAVGMVMHYLFVLIKKFTAKKS
ncbi:MAG: sodium-independent anion transporter [Clostridia bacterium]|nr:sodium-independent anion transporter [Clostridia bacterium]